MAIIRPQAPTRPPRSRSWLKDEWDHWLSMDPQRFCLLVLPSLLLFVIDPLLPPAAYLIQLWGASSWTWRARWASIEDWAKRGAKTVVALVVLAVLMAWFFPSALALLQRTWSEYLPGILDLSPLDGLDLLARSLLLLPLAPALSMYYEWIDPRTQLEPHRVLTPADFTLPVQTPAQETKEQEAQPPPTTDQATTRPAEPLPMNQANDSSSLTSPTDQAMSTPASALAQEAAPSSIKKRQSRKTTRIEASDTTSAPAQMTIESVLVSHPDQTLKPTRAEQKKQRQTDGSHTAPSPGRTLHPEDIDWNNVVE